MIKLLSPKQVCAHISVSRSTLDRMVAAGEFPRPVRLTARRLAYRVDQVEEWLKAVIDERQEWLKAVIAEREAEAV